MVAFFFLAAAVWAAAAVPEEVIMNGVHDSSDSSQLDPAMPAMVLSHVPITGQMPG